MRDEETPVLLYEALTNHFTGALFHTKKTPTTTFEKQ